MKLQKYCKAIMYICFISSLILTIGSYIFSRKDFITCLCTTISIFGLTLAVHSNQNNLKKSN